MEIERQNLISLASENPHLKKEVNELLSKVAKHRHTYKNKVVTKRYTKKKPLYNPKGDRCLKRFTEFEPSDIKSYAKELFDKGSVDGGCYQIHNEYGKAPSDYQTWYNRNVRKYKKKDSSKPYSGEYQGPEKGKKERGLDNRLEMIYKAPKSVKKEIQKELYKLKNPDSEEETPTEVTQPLTRKKKKKRNFGKKKDTSKTESTTPKTDKPKTDKPKTDKPKTDKPKTTTPKTDTSKTDKPKTITRRRTQTNVKEKKEL